MGDLKKLQTRAEWVKMNISSKDRIIDLGSGDLFVYQVTGLKPEVIVDANYKVVNGELYWRLQHRDELKKVPKLYGNFLVADVTKPLPFSDNSFEVTVSTEVLEHVKNPRAVVEEGLRLSPKFVGTVPAGEHKNHFNIEYALTRRHLEEILAGWNYEIVEIATRYWRGYGFVVRG